jgi:hypothetical protein
MSLECDCGLTVAECTFSSHFPPVCAVDLIDHKTGVEQLQSAFDILKLLEMNLVDGYPIPSGNFLGPKLLELAK